MHKHRPNAKENSEFIVKAVNSHDALVVAIEDMEESRENLEGLVQRLTIQNDALVAASEIYKVVLVLCKEALMNVPVVGKPYDQQHSDFQMNAYNIVIEALEQVK